MKSRIGAFLLLTLFVVGLNAATARRIRFAHGHTFAEVTGHFTSKITESLFVVHASAGQHLKVEIKPLSPNLITAGSVNAPSGKSDGAPGGVIFDSDLVETGDYTIQVYERQENLPGRFSVRVEIK